MSCKCAMYDPDEGRYSCSVSGDGCMYMFPDSKRCAEDWDEGPNVEGSKCPDCKYKTRSIERKPCNECIENNCFELLEG